MEHALTFVFEQATTMLKIIALAATVRIGWEVGGPLGRRVARWIHD